MAGISRIFPLNLYAVMAAWAFIRTFTGDIYPPHHWEVYHRMHFNSQERPRTGNGLTPCAVTLGSDSSFLDIIPGYQSRADRLVPRIRIPGLAVPQGVSAGDKSAPTPTLRVNRACADRAL